MTGRQTVLYRDATNLPREVVERLGGRLAAGTVVQRGRLLEARPWATAEARSYDEGSQSATIVGYSTSFDRPYEVYGGPDAGGWTEVMSPGAWSKTIAERSDIRFLADHQGPAFARVSNGTLVLEEDDLGVLNTVTLDMRRTDARDLYWSVERGDMCEMSCAFRVVRQEWSPDWTERRIIEVIGYDSSVVTFPANPNTLVMASSTDEATPEALTQVDSRRPGALSARAARLELDRLRRRAS